MSTDVVRIVHGGRRSVPQPPCRLDRRPPLLTNTVAHHNVPESGNHSGKSVWFRVRKYYQPQTTQSNLTSFIIHPFCYKQSLAAVSFQSNNGHDSTSLFPLRFVPLFTRSVFFIPLYMTAAGILSVIRVARFRSQFHHISIKQIKIKLIFFND